MMILALLVLLIAFPVAAAELFVGPPGSGNDNGSCGATGSPCASPRFAVNNRMSACDTVTIRAGTYTNNTDAFNPPSGTGEGCRTVVRGDPAASRSSIVLRPGMDTLFVLLSDGKGFITFQHMTWDGSASGGNPTNDLTQFRVGQGVYDGESGTSHHNTFDDIEMKFIRNSGFLTTGHHYRLTNSDFHHIGDDYHGGPVEHQDDHGLYWKGSDGLIQGNRFWTPTAEWNIQNVGGASNNVYDRNVFQGGGGGCITITSGSNITFTNNICYPAVSSYSFTDKNGNSFTLDQVATFLNKQSGVKVYNNTFDGVNEIYNEAGDAQFKNNIYCNSSRAFVVATADSNFTTSCIGFTDRSNRIYTLTNAATAMIDLGTNTSPEVTRDCSNNVRTGTYDIGACEFGGAGPTPVATSLHFLTSPNMVAVNTAMTPPVQVDILDQFGNHMSTASATITLTLAPNPGALTGGGPTATVGGTATFPGVTVSVAGSGYVLTATAGGLASAASNPFTVTEGATACTSPCTIYVNPATGNDTRPCNTVTLGNARQTLAGGLACMTVGGSTLYLRAGTYNGCIDTSVTPIASGSTGAPTTIAAYANEAVTLAPTAPAASACQAVVILRNSDHDMVFSGITFDAGHHPPASSRVDSNGFVFYPGTHHVRLQNSIVRNTFYEGVFLRDASDNAVVDSTIEQSAWYGINVVDSSTRTLLDNLMVRNHANEGIFIINGSIFTVNRVTLTGNGVSGTLPAIRVGGTGNSGSLIANSVVAGNYAGMDITSGASGLKVYNNTVANNTTAGVTISAGATGTLLTNTIMTGHPPTQDLVNNAGLSTVQTTLLFTNPGFDGGATCPYCLTPAATAAINVGTALAADVPLDRAGITRPQGIGFDIGAYECPDPCPCEVPPEPVSQLKAPVWQTGGFFRK